MNTQTQLEKLLNQKKINRRAFIAKATALGLTAALSPTILTRPVKAATPKKGGRLRVGTDGGFTTDSLDPATITDLTAMLITRGLLRNNLIELNHKGNLVPELAESWEATSDATQWTFRLRKGVEFHDGKTFEAEDVLFTINHHRSESSKSGAKGLLTSIKNIKSDGKHTVVFTLEGGNADFPYYLTDYHLGILPAGSTDLEKGIGTGGYKLVKHEPGVNTFAKRDPNYWKKGRAHFDEVEVIVINDGNSRTNALKTGSIDLMNAADTKTAHLLKKSPDYQLISTPGWLHYTMPMHCDTAPYDNNDVRLALKYAIDREQILKIVLRGYGAIGNDHPIPVNNKYHAADLPQRKYDPEKARYHLKKSGLANYEFKLHHPGGVFPYSDFVLLYSEQAAKAGVNIKVAREPMDGYGSNVWNKEPFCTTYWNGRATADQMFATTYASNAPWNDSHFKHERFTNLMLQARSELDEVRRAEMYFEMQKILYDQGGVVVPLFGTWLEAASSKLKHGEVAGDVALDGLLAPERWWFA